MTGPDLDLRAENYRLRRLLVLVCLFALGLLVALVWTMPIPPAVLEVTP